MEEKIEDRDNNKEEEEISPLEILFLFLVLQKLLNE